MAGPIRGRRSRICLRETWFTPTGWGEALYVPPISRGWFLRSAVAWERAGASMSAPFAGVHIVEATKQVYRAIPARRERRRLVPALQPVLAPSPGAAALTPLDHVAEKLGLSSGHGSAVTDAASAPTSSARLSRRSRSSAAISAALISATRPRPRNTNAE